MNDISHSVHSTRALQLLSSGTTAIFDFIIGQEDAFDRLVVMAREGRGPIVPAALGLLASFTTSNTLRTRLVKTGHVPSVVTVLASC